MKLVSWVRFSFPKLETLSCNTYRWLALGDWKPAEMVTGQFWLVYKESGLSPLPSASCPTPGRDRSYAKADSPFSQPSWGVTLPSKAKIMMLSEHNHRPSWHQQISALSIGPAPHWLAPRLFEECVTGVPNHCQLSVSQEGPRKVRDLAQVLKAYQARKQSD